MKEIDKKYNKSMSKSTNTEIIKIGSKHYVMNKERFAKFKKNVTTTTAVALVGITIIITGSRMVKNRDVINQKNLETNNLMVENGYTPLPRNGSWERNYAKLDDIDLYSLILYLGDREIIDEIVQHRGYDSLDDYAKQTGYENSYEYINESSKQLKDEAKSKGGK